MVDDQVRVIYPLNFDEEQIQGLIQELKNLDYSGIKSLYLDTEDIAISLVFYFKDLIEKSNKQELDISIYVKEPVYEMLVQNFAEIFGSDKLRMQ